MAGLKEVIKQNPNLVGDVTSFEPDRRNAAVSGLRELLENDSIIQRILTERKSLKNIDHATKARIRDAKLRIPGYEKEISRLKRLIKLNENRIKMAGGTLIRQRKKRKNTQAKLKENLRELTSRRTALVMNANGLFLKDFYKEMGLPIPEKLRKIRNLAQFEPSIFNNNNTDDTAKTDKSQTEEGENPSG